MTIDRHHLLECILWPNGDGKFRKIVNRAKRLEDLGVYNEWKLTIQIERNIHQTMHWEFEKGTEYERSGENTPWYGKTGEKTPMYGRTGDKHPMYGRTGDKSPSWKGDKAGPQGMYVRAKKLYKSGQITREELQHFRDAWNEYRRPRRRKS